jgi:hypothetical protein
LKAVNPEAIAGGKVWSSTDQVKRYLEGDELDLTFEFDLVDQHERGKTRRKYPNAISLRASPLAEEHHSVVLCAPGLWEPAEITAPLITGENGSFETYNPLSDDQVFPGLSVSATQLQVK